MNTAEHFQTEREQMERRIAAAEDIAKDARRAFENFCQRWAQEDVERLASQPHDARLKARMNGSDPLEGKAS
jgi:hypothetical protein